MTQSMGKQCLADIFADIDNQWMASGRKPQLLLQRCAVPGVRGNHRNFGLQLKRLGIQYASSFRSKTLRRCRSSCAALMDMMMVFLSFVLFSSAASSSVDASAAFGHDSSNLGSSSSNFYSIYNNSVASGLAHAS